MVFLFTLRSTIRSGLSALAAVLFLVTLPATPAVAGATPAEDATPSNGKSFQNPLPTEVEQALASLFTLLGSNGGSLDEAAVAPLLDFVAKGDFDAQALKPEKREGGNGVVLKEDIHAPLSRILQYAYNPDIPNFLVFPSVLRLTGWLPGSDMTRAGMRLWDALNTPQDKPVILWGKEFEVITPDSSTGAYYRYDLARCVALTRHNGHNVLISISRMPEESQLGQKGVPMDDQNWNYFYSGINGLNRGLISWMDTQLYNSLSVQILYERDPSAPLTSLTLFKWLNAGWQGLNVVTGKHIYNGNLRFVKGFKTVMESGSLPEPGLFAKAVGVIRNLPDLELDAKIREYAKAFEALARDFKNMDSSEFRRIWENAGYASVLDREQRVGVLLLEYMKSKLGKPTLVDMDFVDSLVSGRPTEAQAPSSQPQGGG